MLWVGLAGLVVVLVAVPVLLFTLLGRRTNSRSATARRVLESTDIGPVQTTGPTGPDGLPLSLHAPAPGNGQVVDANSAHRIIADTWELRLQVIHDHNDALLAKFETGVQLDADRNDCGCDPPPGTTIRQWSASATRQTSYPQHFLGEVIDHIAGTDDFALLSFRRDAADQPWKLEAVSGAIITPTFGPPLTPSPAPLDLDADPTTLSVNPGFAALQADEMNSYLQYWADHGNEKPGSYLSAGSGGLFDRGAAIPQRMAVAHAHGVDLTYEYRDASPSDGAPIFPASESPGSSVVCGGSTYTATYTPSGGAATFHQPEGNDAAVDPTYIGPGDYRRVVVTGFRPWCLFTTADHKVYSTVGFTGTSVQATKRTRR